MTGVQTCALPICDGFKSQFQLSAAVAAHAVEDVARQALRMHPHEWRVGGGLAANFTQFQDNRLFDSRPRLSLKAEDSEVGEAGRKIGFRNFT